MPNWAKIGRSAAKLLRIFHFQNGGRPPSWIWYDIIAVHPRFVFDGPNIVLKLHVDRDYTLQDIAIFIFGPFGLKLCLITPFLGVTINRENTSTGSTWASAREKIQHNEVTNQEKVTKP